MSLILIVEWQLKDKKPGFVVYTAHGPFSSRDEVRAYVEKANIATLTGYYHHFDLPVMDLTDPTELPEWHEAMKEKLGPPSPLTIRCEYCHKTVPMDQARYGQLYPEDTALKECGWACDPPCEKSLMK